jgi:hypothetical protein
MLRSLMKLRSQRRAEKYLYRKILKSDSGEMGTEVFSLDVTPTDSL